MFALLLLALLVFNVTSTRTTTILLLALMALGWLLRAALRSLAKRAAETGK